MKAPNKFPKKITAKKPDLQMSGSGINVHQIVDATATSIEAIKAYANYMKEAEETKRVQIHSQKEIILGSQKLEKARMKHAACLKQLDNEDQDSLRRHEQVMAKLTSKEKKLNNERVLQDRVLTEMAAQKITPEEAAILLYRKQE